MSLLWWVVSSHFDITLPSSQVMSLCTSMGVYFHLEGSAEVSFIPFINCFCIFNSGSIIIWGFSCTNFDFTGIIIKSYVILVCEFPSFRLICYETSDQLVFYFDLWVFFHKLRPCWNFQSTRILFWSESFLPLNFMLLEFFNPWNHCTTDIQIFPAHLNH